MDYADDFDWAQRAVRELLRQVLLSLSERFWQAAWSIPLDSE